MMMLQWTDTHHIQLDSNILFSKGYDHFGLQHLRQEASGSKGNYLIWHNIGRWWSLYRDTDGGLMLEAFPTEEECKARAEGWDVEGTTPYSWAGCEQSPPVG